MYYVDIAQVCHEANRALQLIQNDPSVPVSPDWHALDEETRQSAIDGVFAITSGQVTTPIESHDRWLKFKRDAGWSYGPIKDPVTKQHPCYVSYDELLAIHKIKDTLFFAIVNALEDDLEMVSLDD